MRFKPKFEVDAVVMIDCWAFDYLDLVDIEGSPFSQEIYKNYMSRWRRLALDHLRKIKFDTLINATYRMNPALPVDDRGSMFSSRDQFQDTINYAEFRDAKLSDIAKYVPPGGKIIVGGGSWGACYHYRPVGATRLIKEGYNVYTCPEICYTEGNISKGDLPIPYEAFLHDDIVWSRTYENGYMYPQVFHGLMTHPDNALGRVNPHGEDMRNADN